MDFMGGMGFDGNLLLKFPRICGPFRMNWFWAHPKFCTDSILDQLQNTVEQLRWQMRYPIFVKTRCTSIILFRWPIFYSLCGECTCYKGLPLVTPTTRGYLQYSKTPLLWARQFKCFSDTKQYTSSHSELFRQIKKINVNFYLGYVDVI